MKIRRATLEDVDLIYEWANDPTTRAQSFNSNPIEYDSHVTWFERKLEDPDCRIYIFSDEELSVGSLRLQKELIKEASRTSTILQISYQVAPSMRGKGYGQKIIESIDKSLLKQVGSGDTKSFDSFFDNADFFLGEVKPQNIASVKCFEHAGFTKESPSDKEEENDGQTEFVFLKKV